jgi:hypothetical protein
VRERVLINVHVRVRPQKEEPCALKRGTSEGVTTLRELPAKFGCVRTAKASPVLAADSSISPPRRVLLRSSLSWLRCLIARRPPFILALRVLGLRSAILSTFPFYDRLALGCKTLFSA